MEFKRRAKDIQKAWSLRYNQRIEETIAIVSSLKIEVGLPTGELTLDLLRSLIDKADDGKLFGDLVLLSASLLRVQRNIKQSQRLIENVEIVLQERNLLPHFRLLFEKGVTSLIHGNYGQALEEFLGASKMAPSADTKGAALLNSLLCVEDLGFDTSRIYKETAAVLKKLKPSEFPGIFDQMDSFDLRQAFRHGQFQKFKGVNKLEMGLPYQAQYYKLWTSQLPFHRYSEKEFPDAHKLVSKTNQYLYQRSYRMGTLLGTVNPNDKDITKPTEIVERLYLWVWRWLASGTFPIQKIMTILRNGSLVAEITTLSAEDIQMVRNTLLWLGLFDPSGLNDLAVLLSRFKAPVDGQVPLLELEQLVIEYFKAIRDGHKIEALDFREQMETHPLWNNPDLYFKALVGNVEQEKPPRSSPLSNLTQNLRTLLNRDRGCESSGVIVDMSKFQISTGGDKRKIFSQPICLALDTLHVKTVMSCEEFVRKCFGVNFYDPTNHNPKIFNLLSRMRKVIPETLRLRVKMGYVISEGGWQGIHFLKDNRVSEELKQQPEWRMLLASPVTSMKIEGQPLTKTKILASLSEKGEERPLHRKEIESLLNKSRSTTNRLLEKLVKEGFIKKEGNARNTRYFIIKNLGTVLKEDQHS